MGNYGIKVTKPGFDVSDAALKDQVFNSEANSLKIWMAGSVNITKSAGSGDYTANVAHSLGYSPFYLCFFKLVHASKLWFQESLDDSLLLTNYVYGFAYSNNTNLVLTVRDNSGVGAFTATVYYLILIDKAYE